jgi:hypothetical protein
MGITRAQRFICSVLTAIALVCATPLAHAETGGYDFERVLFRQYEWVFYCDMDKVPKYMTYKGSPLDPIIRFAVTFQYTRALSRRRDDPPPPPVKYEEIWYHDGKAIGMKRYNDFWPGPLQQGVIYFRSPEDVSLCDYPREMANACIRLMMDTYAKRSIMAGAVVPVNAFDVFSSYLQYYSFFPLNQAANGKGENMSLHVHSYPRGREMYFYYDDTGRGGQ